MKKLLFLITILYSIAGHSQTLYIPNNPDSIKVPVNLSGTVRTVYEVDLNKNNVTKVKHTADSTALKSSIALKVNLSDTSAMLTPYLRKIDSTLANRVTANTIATNSKWNITGNALLSRTSNYLGSSDTSQLNISTKGISAINVDSSQKVSIPVSLTTPLINGGTAANDDITIQGTSNATRATSYVNLQPNGGLVGIGTTSPTGQLEVKAPSDGGALYLIGRTSDDAQNLIFYNSAKSTQLAKLSSSATNFVIYTNTIPAIEINSSGKIGLGGGPSSSAVNVTGSIASSGNLTLGTNPAIGVAGGNLYLSPGVIAQGKLSVSTSVSATALLHIAAGTATTNTAPIQINAGTRETTPGRGGLIEYETGKFVLQSDGLELGGNLIFKTDNTYNIGASGANRPGVVYVANQLRVGSSNVLSDGTLTLTGTDVVTYSGSSNPLTLGSSSGNMSFNFISSNSTPLFRLGGTTSSFPALKRSTTTLQVRLADDSDFGAIQSLYDRYGSGSPESAVTAPIGAVFHRTDGGAGTSLYVKESGAGNTGWIAK